MTNWRKVFCAICGHKWRRWPENSEHIFINETKHIGMRGFDVCVKCGSKFFWETGGYIVQYDEHDSGWTFF